MYCLELIKFDVSKTSYYVEVENGALLRDVARSWKMILGGHGKSLKSLGKFWEQSVGTGNPDKCSVFIPRCCWQ